MMKRSRRIFAVMQHCHAQHIGFISIDNAGTIGLGSEAWILEHSGTDIQSEH